MKNLRMKNTKQREFFKTDASRHRRLHFVYVTRNFQIKGKRKDQSIIIKQNLPLAQCRRYFLLPCCRVTDYAERFSKSFRLCV